MTDIGSTPISRRKALASLLAPALASCLPDSLLGPLDRMAASAGTAGSVTLIGAGDVHGHFNHAVANKATARLIEADPSSLVFALGDNAGVHGSVAEYGYYDDYWGGFKERTLFQIGNHDFEADPTAAPYFNYTDAAGGPRGKAYYAKTLGAWRCYFLNSEQLRSEQAAWLAADLPNYPRLHKAAFWHKPMFSSVCRHDGGSQMAVPSQAGPWWSILQKHRAELVVSGHVHRYERFPRMLRDGTPSSAGIRQFIAGTGGGIKMPVLTPHPLSQKQVIEYGVFRLTLRPDRYEWKFIDLAGVVRDSGSLTCRTLVVA